MRSVWTSEVVIRDNISEFGVQFGGPAQSSGDACVAPALRLRRALPPVFPLGVDILIEKDYRREEEG